jgi:chemotaxis protein methyltransferase CheR
MSSRPGAEAPPTVEPRLLEAAAAAVARYTGFTSSAVSREALKRALLRAAQGAAGPAAGPGAGPSAGGTAGGSPGGNALRAGDAAALLEAALRGDASLVHPLAQAAMVGETYLFRHPEHFQLLLERTLPALLGRGATALRAWSAGCASGEEAYSLAGVLKAAAERAARERGGPPASVEVVGTDLSEAALASARAAVYGEWSVRPAGPHLVPVLEPLPKGAEKGARRTVLPELRALCRFQPHNLLATPPEALGTFDVIFCRNVLCYFERDMARTVAAHLASVLRPGGLLAFAAVDVDGVPPGLVPWGEGEVQLFTRPLPGAAHATPQSPRAAPVKAAPVRAAPARLPPAKAAPVKPAPPEPAPAKAAPARPAAPKAAAPAKPAPGKGSAEGEGPAGVAWHLAALEHIERGELGRAVELLEALVDAAPGYAPGLLELALLRQREGRAGEAAVLMQELLAQLEGLDEGAGVDGPEVLPVRYYRASARAFLAARRVGP